jgi:L-ribulose-5-phosphate 4-epimerase
MNIYKELQQECYECNMKLTELGLVIFTFGNVSIVDRDKAIFAIKPSGVPYADLKPADIVICDYDAKVVSGNMRPSSDTKTHAVLYKEWHEVGGISHTHSTYATAWAQSLLDIPIFGTTHADHLTTDIPCAPPMKDEYIQGDYEHMTGYQIIDHFNENKLDYNQIQMVLVGNHAPFTWGKNGTSAVYNSAILEELAKMAHFTKLINPDALRMKDSLIKKHFERKHGSNAYYGQNN